MNLFNNLKYRVDLLGESLDPAVDPILKIEAFKNFYQNESYPNGFQVKIIKYIGLMYDHSSPYPVEYRDLDKRKSAVADYCSFPKVGGKYKKSYREFMDLETDASKILILSFLQDLHYQVWTEIQTTEQELWEITQLRWERISTVQERVGKEGAQYSIDIADKEVMEAANKKEKLMAAAKKRREYLKELYDEMFADNQDVKSIAKEYPITPETAVKYFEEAI